MFYRTVHHFFARVQSPTCTTCGKFLLKSIMAVLTLKLGILVQSGPFRRGVLLQRHTSRYAQNASYDKLNAQIKLLTTCFYKIIVMPILMLLLNRCLLLIIKLKFHSKVFYTRNEKGSQFKKTSNA